MLQVGATHSAATQLEIAETLLTGPSSAVLVHAPHFGPSDLLQRYRATRRQLRFQVGDAANRCDTYNVAPWLVMTVVDVGCVDRFESALSGQDIVEFHFRLSGSIELTGSWGEVSLREPACLLWYQPTGCDDASELVGDPGRTRESWVSLYCDRSTLLGVASAVSSSLLDCIGEPHGAGAVPQFRIYPRIGPMIPTLREIVNACPQDPLHWILASSKAYELLYMALTNADMLCSEPSTAIRLTARDRQCLAAVRDILSDQYAAPPSLTALARRVGVNHTKLCYGFRLLYGESTSEFVRRRRMEAARELLQTSDLQVRQVARTVGYSHHSTFTAAFARHFGVAPKLIRRSMSPFN